jgi:hypothetical protein
MGIGQVQSGQHKMAALYRFSSAARAACYACGANFV